MQNKPDNNRITMKIDTVEFNLLNEIKINSNSCNV